ncbi:MAG: tRNA-guanine transglycosylase [bacterium]
METKKAKQINLNNIEHKREFDRIIKGCRCYTCENHTRAYIHHLLICKEMTANVLLTIHNLYTY